MKYLSSAPFSTAATPGQTYRDNWDAIFSKNLEDGVIRDTSTNNGTLTVSQSPLAVTPTSDYTYHDNVAADVELSQSDSKEPTTPAEEVVTISAKSFWRLIDAIQDLRCSTVTRRTSKKEAELFSALADIGY